MILTLEAAPNDKAKLTLEAAADKRNAAKSFRGVRAALIVGL